jgi:hypothetical protein
VWSLLEQLWIHTFRIMDDLKVSLNFQNPIRFFKFPFKFSHRTFKQTFWTKPKSANKRIQKYINLQGRGVVAIGTALD